eukprot:10843988-Lingulodinium_polyedra.AAC.1
MHEWAAVVAGGAGAIVLVAAGMLGFGQVPPTDSVEFVVVPADRHRDESDGPRAEGARQDRIAPHGTQVWLGVPIGPVAL